MKIYIATHKQFAFPQGIDTSIYIPIQVGNDDNDLGYMRENNADNIAYKNRNFCELTVLYYIWKNIDEDIIGLVHYRRYLYKKHKLKKVGFFYIPWKSRYEILTESDVRDILDGYDIIVPRVNNIQEDENVKIQYGRTHHIEDWIITKEVIAEKFPEYVNAFEFVENGKKFYGCNMFIARKKTMIPYFEWLFDVLFEVERRVNIEDYSDYQKRIFGFLSERLFTVWLIHHQSHLKIYETKFKLVE